MNNYKIDPAQISAIQQAVDSSHAWSGYTDPRIMYLGQNDGQGNLLVANAGTNSRVVWAHELGKPPEVVDLPPWPLIQPRNDPTLENASVWTVMPPNQPNGQKRRMIYGMNQTLDGQAQLGTNGVTPFESEYNQVAALLIPIYSPNQVLASPITSPGTLSVRPLVANDLPNSGVTAGSYTNASIAVDAKGRVLSAANGTAPVTAIGVTAPITSTGGLTPTIGLTVPLALNYGGTDADLSATGGAHQFVKQSSAGAALTVGTISAADLPSGIVASPLTTRGDIWAYSTADTRQPVGANYAPLVADSTQTTGLNYTNAMTSALMLPNGNTTQRPSPGTLGLIRFNNSTDRFEVCIGSSVWVNFVNLTGDTMSGNLQAPSFTISPGGAIKPSSDSINAINFSSSSTTPIVAIDTTNRIVNIVPRDTFTSSISTALKLYHTLTTINAGVNGIGVDLFMGAADNASAIGTGVNTFRIRSYMPNAADASYTSITVFTPYDKNGGGRDALQLVANGSRQIAYVFPGTQTTNLAALGGTLFNDFTDAGNSTTTETDTYTHSVPGNALATNGDGLEWDIFGTSAGSATATTELRVYFGGTVVADTGAIAITSADQWHIHVSIIRDSSTSVRVGVDIYFSGGVTFTSSPFYATVTGLTLSSNQTFKVTAQRSGVGAATNDILAKQSRMRWLSAA